MKRPSFQFYPSDWLRDTALRSCSVGARGLWIDMICFMHEGTPYGHLKVNNKVILPNNLSRMVGETLDVVERYLHELKDAGVYQIDDDGAIYSKRMVKDEIVRNQRAMGGKKGGNPALMANKVNLSDNLEVNQEVYLKDKQKTTPSSSSSSSINKTEKRSATGVDRPESVSKEIWIEFNKICKAKGKPVGELVLKKLVDESQKAGWSLERALTWCCEKGFARFEASWVAVDKPKLVSNDTFAGSL